MTLFSDLRPFSVGFDSIFDQLDKLTNTTRAATGWPPYNIKKVEDNKYVIELAVAGFSKSEIELELKENTLTISGRTNSDESTYLYKGIADRSFSRTFNLADTVEIKNAELINGMLRIWLENIIPESRKPKKIEIQDESTSRVKQIEGKKAA